jgi:TatD DNase family protein
MLFDTHAHCDDEWVKNSFGDTEDYIRHQLENGISFIVNIGTNLENSGVSVALSKKFEQIYASCGVHPYDVRLYENENEIITPLRTLLANEKVVALGEIGLDYHYEDSDFEKQKRFFVAQMELARELNIPVIIHDRDAHGDCMDIIRAFPEVTGIFHCFSGSAEMAQELVKLGWFISFSGVVTYKNARRAIEACESVPMDRILIETDSPYLAPTTHRGEMNQPKYVRFTCEKVAEIKGVSFDEMAHITLENAKKVYRLNK